MEEELNNDIDDVGLAKQGRNTAFIDNQWKPGQSGNPGGRPVGKSITAELRKLIDSGTNAQDMAKILYALCKRLGPDQMKAFKELLDRTDGKVAETHKIEGDIPVTIIFKPAKESDAAK